MCCIFHVFESAGAQECCLQSVTLPLLPQKASNPLAAISWVGRGAKAQCGMCVPVPAGSCRAHLEERRCLCSHTATAQGLCCCSGVGINTQHACPARRAPHLSLTFRKSWFFLVKLSNRQWRMNWFKGHDCTGCLFQNISLSMQWNLNYSTILGSQPVSSRSPRSIQTG